MDSTMDNESTSIDWGIKGLEFYEAKEYEKAIKCYEKAIELDPNNANAYYNCGIALADLAENKIGKERDDLFNDTIEKYEEAARLYKTKADKASAFNNWGLALHNLAESKIDKRERENLFKEAIEKYKKATKLDPEKC